MLLACWSVKGGVGATVTSCALALSVADRGGHVLLVDLAGDVPGCLGLAEPAGAGLAEWLAAGPDVPTDALGRLESTVAPSLAVLHRGHGPLEPRRAAVLVQLLAADGRQVVVDCGRIDVSAVAHRFAAEADRSVLVVRPCVLAVRRAVAAPVRPSGLLVVRDPGRALTGADLEAAIGAPVLAELAVDPAVARAVDAGLLHSRRPRGLAGALGAVAA